MFVRRQLTIELHIRTDIPQHTPPPFACDRRVLSPPMHCPSAWTEQASNNTQQRRLARPIVAGDNQRIPGLEVGADTVQDLARTIRLPNLVNLQTNMLSAHLVCILA